MRLLLKSWAIAIGLQGLVINSSMVHAATGSGPTCGCVQVGYRAAGNAAREEVRKKYLAAVPLRLSSGTQLERCAKNGHGSADLLMRASDEYLFAGIDSHFGGREADSKKWLGKARDVARKALRAGGGESQDAREMIKSVGLMLAGNWMTEEEQYGGMHASPLAESIQCKCRQ